MGGRRIRECTEQLCHWTQLFALTSHPDPILCCNEFCSKMVENRCSAAAGTLRPVMKCCSWLRIGWELVGSLLGPIFIACSCIHPPFYSPIGSFAKENKKSNAAFHISPQSLCLCPYWKSKQQKSRFKRFHLLYWKQKWGPLSLSLQQTLSSLVTLARFNPFFLGVRLGRALFAIMLKYLLFLILVGGT